MNSYNERIRPGVMISQTWPNVCDIPGGTLDAFRFVLEDGFFAAVQTVHVGTRKERQEIARLIENTGVHYTYSLARLLKKHDLNISASDDLKRVRAVSATCRMLDDAREAGAHSVCVVSGPRPPSEDTRAAALASLEESLVNLGRYASERGLELLIEPLDFFADKMNSLGTIREAEQIVRNVRIRDVSIGLCVDTAHMILNGEALDAPWFNWEATGSTMRELHFCNAVPDRNHPSFGDKHIAFGSPGILYAQDIPPLLRYALENFNEERKHRLRVFCEVLNTKPNDASAALYLYRYVKNILSTL